MLSNGERRVPQTTYMSDEQMTQYLRDLRRTRLERPSGSRPPPPSRVSSTRRSETDSIETHKPKFDPHALQRTVSVPVTKQAQPVQEKRNSISSIRSPFAGHALVRPPSVTSTVERSISPTPTEQERVRRVPSITYLERGSRWMEKQEAQSIRMAMAQMDLEEEKKLHTAARDEAAELVWHHQNPGAPYQNPDAKRTSSEIKADYRSHLRRGSYRRSVSQESLARMHRAGDPRGSKDFEVAPPQPIGADGKVVPADQTRRISPPSAVMSVSKTRAPSGPSYGGLAEAVANDIARAQRRTSSGSRRILSMEKKMFMNPNDRIWEDPQGEMTPPRKGHGLVGDVKEPTRPAQPPIALPSHVRKNPFARVRMQAAKLERSQSDSVVQLPTDSSQTHSMDSSNQKRNPWYMSNVPLPPPKTAPASADEVSPKKQATKDGIEIRGDDIRAATSKSRKDYSPNLPRPTVVSDKPGRPIVSFNDGWKPRETTMEEMPASPSLQRVETDRGPPRSEQSRGGIAHPQPPSRSLDSRQTASPDPQVSHPAIPVIICPDDRPEIPTISLPDAVPSIVVGPPTIHIDAPSISVGAPKVAVTPSKSSPAHSPSRPSPHHAATFPLQKSSPHYTPSVRQSGILCAHCAIPIAGRILSAAGERFHPACFNCHECNTNLELVAFYPEPESKREERLARIDARLAGFDVTLPAGSNAEDARRLEASDGTDGSRRFYCHLDFHELFSPRCKSCKTPIEGEVVVACGAEWHAGHFFCAQCGDPFDAKTPFVEKDGYAWCVGCHTNRYSAKCRGCRKPVVDMVVKALGAEWHAQCFVCTECKAEFSDGRFFLRGDDQNPVCVACEERRLKA